MKGKHNESLSLRLFNNGKDVKMERKIKASAIPLWGSKKKKISPKLQRIWSWNFGFAIRKIWAFIWYQKIYYLRLSPVGRECDRRKGLLV